MTAPCPATQGLGRCCYRLGHDLSIFPHRYTIEDPMPLTYTIPSFGSERFYAERPPSGTRVWAHTGDGCVWPATVVGPAFNPFVPDATTVRFDDPSHDGETMVLPFRQLQVKE